MSGDNTILPPMATRRVGSIELIIGPMFSEKTTTMMAQVKRAAYANKRALMIKWINDTRYADGPTVTSHGALRQSSSGATATCEAIRVVSAAVLAEVAAGVTEHDDQIIGIDEGQFYPDLVAQCQKWANEGRRVIVAALDGDYLRRPFGQVCELVPLCESVQKQRGICMLCRGAESAFTRRLGASEAIIEIGAAESYMSVCRACYGS